MIPQKEKLLRIKSVIDKNIVYINNVSDYFYAINEIKFANPSNNINTTTIKGYDITSIVLSIDNLSSNMTNEALIEKIERLPLETLIFSMSDYKPILLM